jgi:ubiquitin carboxyl-terminal hydrolase 34
MNIRKRTLDLEFAHRIWQILCEILQDGHAFPEASEQFFASAAALFEALSKARYQEIDYGRLFEIWMSQLCGLEVSEVVGRPANNHTVKGFTQLLRWCVLFGSETGLHFDNGMAHVIWSKLLFPRLESESDAATEKIPILHDEIRTELYNLLTEMISTREDRLNLVRLNNELFDDGSCRSIF